MEFSFPDRIETLEEAGEFSDCYEPAQTWDGYVLKAVAKEQIARCSAELEEIEKRNQEHLEQLEAKVRSKKDTIRRLLVQREILAALRVAGVPPKLEQGARAAIEEDLDIHVEETGDDHRLSVSGPYGRMTVAQAVGRWLSSDVGIGFVQHIKPSAGREPGPFELAIRRLEGKERVH